MTAVDQSLTFGITATDGYDSLLRLLTDAQRFGLHLTALNLQTKFEGCKITLTISSSHQVDRTLLAVRLARHPTVSQVELLSDGQTELVEASGCNNDGIAA